MIEMSRFEHVVIGSRYVPGGGTKNWGWNRVLLSATANFVARTLLGLQAHDVTAGFRLYRREVLASIPLNRIFPAATLSWLRCCFCANDAVGKLVRCRSFFEDRRDGTTKISSKEIVKAQYTVFASLSVASRR